VVDATKMAGLLVMTNPSYREIAGFDKGLPINSYPRGISIEVIIMLSDFQND
jgi:hypothetical protein